MSSAISGSLNLSRAQSQIPIDEAGAASNIQNFSTYDAVELIGYVYVDGSSADYRASVKLSIVKNGAGSYEVAASDIAGDDYSGSPIVSFSMSGSLLQATLDSALVAAESPSESYIRYALSAPAVGGQDNISIDASKIVSGTIDSGVLPEATSSVRGTVLKPNGTLRLDTGSGYGSTNTKIRRFANITEQVGDAFTYADSSTNGMSVTANRDMIAAISYCDRSTSGATNIGISLNASGTDLTTNIITVSADKRLCQQTCSVATADSNIGTTIKLSQGDVIRVHTDGNTNNTSDRTMFTIQEIFRL